MALAIAANQANGGLGEVALPALAHAHRGAGGYGALLACLAGGAVTGTLIAARSGAPPNPAMIASTAVIIQAATITAVPYPGGQAAAAALLFLGVCNGLASVLSCTIAQRSIPTAILGRVISMTMPCSLVRHIGTTPFFPIAGIFLAIAVLGGNTQRAFPHFGRQPEPSQRESQPA